MRLGYASSSSKMPILVSTSTTEWDPARRRTAPGYAPKTFLGSTTPKVELTRKKLLPSQSAMLRFTDDWILITFRAGMFYQLMCCSRFTGTHRKETLGVSKATNFGVFGGIKMEINQSLIYLVQYGFSTVIVALLLYIILNGRITFTYPRSKDDNKNL